MKLEPETKPEAKPDVDMPDFGNSSSGGSTSGRKPTPFHELAPNLTPTQGLHLPLPTMISRLITMMMPIFGLLRTMKHQMRPKATRVESRL